MSRDIVAAKLNKIKEDKKTLVERVEDDFNRKNPGAERSFKHFIVNTALVISSITGMGATFEGCTPGQLTNKDDKAKNNSELLAEQIDAYINDDKHMTYDAAKEMLAEGVKNGHIKADTATYSTWNDNLIAHTICYEVNKKDPGKFEKIKEFTAVEYNYVGKDGELNGETSLMLSKSVEDRGYVTFKYPNINFAQSYKGDYVKDTYYQSVCGEINKDYEKWNGEHVNYRVLYKEDKPVAVQDYRENEPTVLALKRSGNSYDVIMGVNDGIDGHYYFYGSGEDLIHINNDSLTPAKTHSHGKIYGSTR